MTPMGSVAGNSKQIAPRARPLTSPAPAKAREIVCMRTEGTDAETRGINAHPAPATALPGGAFLSRIKAYSVRAFPWTTRPIC